ncbi:MAG: hypothetical protein A4E30_00178 [Methanomassiliicoccales archaeon PtaB.Bin215]|nr:MAG: hypothetical protein A4E30_00178 [Methanomassiliicoccales archaeon PtaB.Bin215]
MKAKAVRDFSPPLSASSLSTLPLRGLAFITSPPRNGSCGFSSNSSASPPPDSSAYTRRKLALTASNTFTRLTFFLSLSWSVRATNWSLWSSSLLVSALSSTCRAFFSS